MSNASRWKYKAEKVTVDDNSQNVRKFTAGERKAFALKSREVREKKFDANDLPMFILSMAAVDPPVTIEEAHEMPPDLLDACVRKIMQLSGFKDEPEKDEPAAAAAPADEKKDQAPPPTSS